MTAGDLPAAADALARAEALDADRPLTLVALGLVYNNSKRFAEARTRLARSVELDPDSSDALAALAEAEAGLGDLPSAERDAARVLSKVPANATANLVLGLVRIAQERYPEARDALLAAAAADPRSPKADYQLSLVYARMNDAASADRHLDLYRRKLREMEATLKALQETGFGAGIRR
jgi:tetratricopeptide (TPR) repeat protein